MTKPKSPNSKPAILHLNLHREFFAQIAAGTKRTEYRNRTIYWRRRLEGRHYDVIQSRLHSVLARQVRNGYAIHLRSLRRDKSASVAS